MVNKTFFQRMILVLMSLAIVAVGGCSSTRELGQKPQKIRFAIIADMIGPNAPADATAVYGFVDAVRYLNDIGGIRGVNIETVIKDTGGKPELAQRAFDEIMALEPRPVLLFSPLPGVLELLRDRLAQSGMLVIGAPWNESVSMPENVFAAYPGYPDMFAAFCSWLNTEWKGSSRPRIAFVTSDDVYGRAVLVPRSYQYAESLGIDIVATETYNRHAINLNTELGRVQAAGADWIFTNAVGSDNLMLFHNMKALGLNAGIAGTTGMDWSVLRSLFKEGSGEGTIAVLPAAGWDEEEQLQGVKDMRVLVFDKASRSISTDMTSMYPIGVAAAVMAQDAMAISVNQAGWDNLRSDVVGRILTETGEFSPLGLAELSYTEVRHIPSKVKIYRFTDGKLLPLTGWTTVPEIR